MTDTLYAASRIRATKAEMEERAEFLIDYAEEHGPVTVRGLYYQAEVRGLPGIDKEENSYAKIQRQVLNLRRAGQLGYEYIADGPDGCGSRNRSTAWMKLWPILPGSTARTCGTMPRPTSRSGARRMLSRA